MTSNLSFHGREALIFDVDGTLYRQPPLRRAMFLKIVSCYCARPWEGWQALRALQAFRHAQEALRTQAGVSDDLAERQLTLACKRSRMDRGLLTSLVVRWMEQEPLPLLPRFVHDGVREFLRAARSRGLRLGVFSDYPAQAKLESMGLHEYFDVVLAAQDPAIGRFKPDPTGLRVTMQRLGASAQATVHVGDRPDVDATAARNAGVDCLILGESSRPSTSLPFFGFANYRQLLELLQAP